MKKDNICGAKTRSGNPCKRKPAKGRSRCRLHGGATPKGMDSPHWKTGLYSKYAGAELKEVLAELDRVSSEDLIQPEQEIRLMSALIMKCKGLENGMDELKDLDTISKILERLIHAKQRSQAIMIEQRRLIPASDIQVFLNWMEDTLSREIGKEKTFTIMDKLKTFRIEDHAT